LLPSINVVTHKEVISFWWETTIFKETQEISELAVDVSANLERSFQFQQNGLRKENITRPETKCPDFGFCHLHCFSWLASSDFQEPGNQRVNIQLWVVTRH